MVVHVHGEQRNNAGEGDKTAVVGVLKNKRADEVTGRAWP